MFERLEEIVLNGEKFLSDAECPEVFLWFPMEKDYVGPAMMNETVEQKTDRLLKLAKKIRSQLRRITSGLDATGEERLLEYLELRNVSEELNGLLAECNEEKTANFDKAKRTVTEVNTSLQGKYFKIRSISIT